MNLKINTSRLWNRLMKMGEIGATPDGGVCRLALTEEDRLGRDLFVSWCEEAGCKVTVDVLGNIFARREGRNPEKKPVLVGSHLDSQPTGGKFDGVLGVLAALEVLETLNDHGVVTEAPVEIVSWTNEEGARFAPAMLASGAYAGIFTREFVESRTDKQGVSYLEALKAIGYRGDRQLGSVDYKASLELHIEQGPVLEASGMSVGLVTGVQGIRWYNLTIRGVEVHAGPTPMVYRKDPVQSLIGALRAIYDLAGQYGPDARITIGSIKTTPGVHNTVPAVVEVAVDLRHPDSETLASMDRSLKQIVKESGMTSETGFELEEIWHSPPVHFDQGCIKALRDAAEASGQEYLEMVSGAGHDSVYLSKVMPSAMIFIPCRGGLSHNPQEHIEIQHAEDGVNVLLHAVIQLAGLKEKVSV